MKKIISILVMITLCASLVACGDTTGNGTVAVNEENSKMKKKMQKNLSECTKNYMIKKVRKNTKKRGGARYDRNRIGDSNKRCSVD